VTAYVRLRVASEQYAIPVQHVVEVAELGQVATVPGAPPQILGLRNLRGQILPAVDLALILGVPRARPPPRMLVAEAEGSRAAFAIDEVSGVGELADPTEEAEGELLLGATLADGELIGVIDVSGVFTSLEQACL